MTGLISLDDITWISREGNNNSMTQLCLMDFEQDQIELSKMIFSGSVIRSSSYPSRYIQRPFWRRNHWCLPSDVEFSYVFPFNSQTTRHTFRLALRPLGWRHFLEVPTLVATTPIRGSHYWQSLEKSLRHTNLGRFIFWVYPFEVQRPLIQWSVGKNSIVVRIHFINNARGLLLW